MNKLEQAARQALEAMEVWSDASASLKGQEAITALREALDHPEREWPSGGEAEQAEQEPLAYKPYKVNLPSFMHHRSWHSDEIQRWLDELPPLYIGPVQQAEQSQLADASLEPVAWMNTNGAVNKLREAGWAMNAPLAQQDTHATHVVRTKDPCHPWQDLTDDEIFELIEKHWDLQRSLPDFARAVIAAYRKKNK